MVRERESQKTVTIKCESYENSLSHFFDKTFVKSTVLLNNLLEFISWGKN